MRLLELHRPLEASNRDRMLGVLLLLALSVAPGTAHARTMQGELPQSPSGTIHGVVTVLGQQAEPSPLESISVELRGNSEDSRPLATLTDSAGHYEFTEWRESAYTIPVSQKAFKPGSVTIVLTGK